ncbi:MAG: MarR family transcriptional regulator [Actinobacteria bacterium]|nr:MarR family transcriptional regulator [Actinomycetota bacterium]MCA1722241.1 MarR family transcriptional regulator [Actinomycetota bacterium]
MAATGGKPPGDIELLLDMSRALVALAVRSMGAIDGAVSLPQFRTLTVLERLGACTAGLLADQVGLHPSTMTRICDRLVADELVTREVQAQNRRQVEVAITPAGSTLVHKVWQARADALNRALRKMTPDQRRCLREVAPSLTGVLGIEPRGGPW